LPFGGSTSSKLSAARAVSYNRLAATVEVGDCILKWVVVNAPLWDGGYLYEDKRIRGPDQEHQIVEHPEFKLEAPHRGPAGLSTGMIGRLGFAWLTVALFLLFGGSWLAGHTPVWQAGALFLWLFVVIMWSSFGCVKEADSLADLLGEPLVYRFIK
ncbi:MAG TPA: hypothetical protein VIX37_09510, partial [Candidatus Sulfotelmatobacter sp.]